MLVNDPVPVRLTTKTVRIHREGQPVLSPRWKPPVSLTSSTGHRGLFLRMTRPPIQAFPLKIQESAIYCAFSKGHP
jgi:hypothetical protein